MVFFRIVNESYRQAKQQLFSNKLRSFLTLLGITIGIFCVISVLSSVDSLEANILNSFDKLGNDVLYVDKWPWGEDPDHNFYKYAARPSPSYDDLMAINENSKLAAYSSLMIFVPSSLIKFQNKYVSGAYLAGVTDDYDKVIKLEFDDGRFFNLNEMDKGTNSVILGNKLAEALFPAGNGVGREVKIYGQYFTIAGVLKKEGTSIIQVMPMDEAIIMPWNCIRKFVNVKSNTNFGTLLNVKAKKSEQLEELKYELASILRPVRGLHPLEKNNFEVNELSVLTNIISKVFGSLNIAGFIIGLFAMLVGAFGVANIMFVSVKERTSIIGIKMAMGAKRYFILLEYLLEAIILCIVGGIVGLTFVWLILTLVSKAVHFDIQMSFSNALLGVFLSVIIGIIAGIIPALHASRMDPVEAIRK